MSNEMKISKKVKTPGEMGTSRGMEMNASALGGDR
jgi:hypothetical protein